MRLEGLGSHLAKLPQALSRYYLDPADYCNLSGAEFPKFSLTAQARLLDRQDREQTEPGPKPGLADPDD